MTCDGTTASVRSTPHNCLNHGFVGTRPLPRWATLSEVLQCRS
jgi:hypothetical protein